MIQHFMIMGGYGAYVWSAYGITLFVFCLNIWISYQEMKKIKKKITLYREQLTHES